MKKSITLIVSLLLTALFLNCDTNKKDDKNKLLPLLFFLQPNYIGNAVWARSDMAGTSESVFNSVSVGNDGIYAAGYIKGNGIYTFGTQSVNGTYATGYNAVLVKYNWDGNAVWAKSVAVGPSESGFNSVSVGSDGIYAAGTLDGNGTYTFGTHSVTGKYSQHNTVLVKYNFSGNAIWASTVATGPNRSAFNSVAVGSDGIYVAGYIYNTTQFLFDSQPVTGTNVTANAVLVKYNTSGNAILAKSVSAGSSYSLFNSVFIGSDGIYAAGHINGIGTYTFGDQSVNGTYAGGSNAVLIKYDTSINALWAKSVSAGSSGSDFNSVFKGSDGIYVAGYITGTGTYMFGDKSVTGTYSGSYNALLLKYNTSGSAIWARTITTGPNISWFNTVSVGSDGIYTAGYISGSETYTFGTQSAAGACASENNAVLVKYQ